jgi:hypothetical protein
MRRISKAGRGITLRYSSFACKPILLIDTMIFSPRLTSSRLQTFTKPTFLGGLKPAFLLCSTLRCPRSRSSSRANTSIPPLLIQTRRRRRLPGCSRTVSFLRAQPHPENIIHGRNPHHPAIDPTPLSHCHVFISSRFYPLGDLVTVTTFSSTRVSR